MSHAGLVLAFLLLAASPASATWSVIAVDQKTGQAVISSATCVAQERFAEIPAKGLMDIQAIVVPGKGIAAAQSHVDLTRANQRLIHSEIQKGTHPQQIIERLASDPDMARRQFGIVDLQGRSAGYSGAKNPLHSLDRQDYVPETGIYVSIQGNTLASDAVVISAVEAFKNAKGALADRVMAAMEAADSEGGDRRCTCEVEPKAHAFCTTKTAQVAYILRADETDQVGASFNDDAYTMYLSVTNGNIKPDEDANPVKTLRLRYETWKEAHVD